MFGPEQITLANICHGAAAEVFERELARVLENIADPNTEPEAKRGITVQFQFLPNGKRSTVVIAYVVKSALAVIKTESSSAFIAMEKGELGLYSMNVDQGILPLQEQTPTAVDEIRPISPQPKSATTIKTAPPSSN